jgi:hypothetical protein
MARVKSSALLEVYCRLVPESMARRMNGVAMAPVANAVRRDLEKCILLGWSDLR